MQKQLRSRVFLGGTFAAITAIVAAGQFVPSRAAESPGTAQAAQAIFQKSCVSCHGNTQPPKGVNLIKRETLITTGVVRPKDAAHSRLIDVVQSGFMPLGGQKLSDADIATLRDWINAGAPDWEAPAAASAPVRKTISEAAILNAIRQDLDAAPERSRPYLRYYSLANSYNNQDATEDLDLYRTSLGKLLNSLSWNPDIINPKTLGPDGTLLRIDLRDLDWTPEIWQRIIAAYPFGFRGRNLSGPLSEIQTLSGVQVPYIRVDWFVANASVAPLYHDILQLPNNVTDLERKLGVSDEADVQEEKVVRAGLRDSGVSHNNRAVERHRSLYGAFWRSFDFASSEGQKNIFENPVDIKPDGGEFIFNLPNGMQGYLVANGKGERLDDAPIKIVRDRTNTDDPVVHNGRSCIGCHFEGMNRFHDQVRPALDTNPHGSYDLEKALALYPGQEKVDASFQTDVDRFLRAVRATGSQPPSKPDDEPVSRLARRYALDLTLSQAAADTGLTIPEFRRRVETSFELQRLGFAQLVAPNGGFKRDAWEADFGTLVEEIHVGDYIKPTLLRGAAALTQTNDNRHTVSINSFTPLDSRQAQTARQDLFVWLNRSDDMRVVSGNAEANLTGTVTGGDGAAVTLSVSDPGIGLTEQVTGSSSDLQFLTQQLANRINFRLTGAQIPINTAPPGGLAGPQVTAAPDIPTDPGLRIQQAVGSQGPVKVTLSLDRGPGSTYHFGDPVHISFKVDRSCFLEIFDLDQQGVKTPVFTSQAVIAGQLYNLDDVEHITAGGTPGLETLIAIANLQEAPLTGKSLIVTPGAASLANNIHNSLPGESSTAVIRFFTVSDEQERGKGLLEVGAK